MPTYTYQCQVCSDVVEKRQNFSDAPLTTCDACGGELRKQIHPVGIVFKGSGFYNTDYRGGNTDGQKTDAAKGEGEDGAAKAKDATSDGDSSKGEAKQGEAKDGGAKSEPSTPAPKTATTAGAKAD